MVCDESSAIKAFDGKRRAIVTEFLRTMPYRLLCTATAAPNDYVELGTSSEALGYLGHMDMLARFFTNKDKTARRSAAGGVRIEHSSGGSRATPRTRSGGGCPRGPGPCGKPSDLGFDDNGFVLPPLETGSTSSSRGSPTDGHPVRRARHRAARGTRGGAADHHRTVRERRGTARRRQAGDRLVPPQRRRRPAHEADRRRGRGRRVRLARGERREALPRSAAARSGCWSPSRRSARGV